MNLLAERFTSYDFPQKLKNQLLSGSKVVAINHHRKFPVGYILVRHQGLYDEHNGVKWEYTMYFVYELHGQRRLAVASYHNDTLRGVKKAAHDEYMESVGHHLRIENNSEKQQS